MPTNKQAGKEEIDQSDKERKIIINMFLIFFGLPKWLLPDEDIEYILNSL